MKPTLHYTTLFLITACLLLPTVEQTYAQWSTDPAINNAISAATSDQDSPTIVNDGSGGEIISWRDDRSGINSDIYAQRINASGAVQWTTNGVAICTATGDQAYPSILSDGTGGAIITWQDSRTGTSDIYAQCINASGTVQWTANGVAICTATGNQFYYPRIVSDGTGGAIISWRDDRSGTNPNIYAQRINASGTVQWTANGVAICTATDAQYDPKIVSDGTGGAIITWDDHRSGTNYDIYAQLINASGAVQWTANGVAISTGTGDQYSPTIVSDGAGGEIIAFQDDRSGTSDMYAQCINASGTVQWTANGVAICTATGLQSSPRIVSDGLSGAIITWYDDRSGTSNYDIYAQRINASGTVQWTGNGVAICSATSVQSSPTIVINGTGGAIITWQDSRNGNGDIYAQCINASGTVQWTADGVAICTATDAQESPTIVGDGTGGAIITWQDYRSGTNYDIYAQRIYENSALPVELASFTAQTFSSRVELVWKTATEVNNYGFEIERRAPGGAHLAWIKTGFVEGNGTTNSPKNYSYTDNNLKTGKYVYRLKQIDRDGKFKYSQEVEFAVGDVPSEFKLMQNYPNPFNPSTRIEFIVPENGRATLKIYDVVGRELETLVSEQKKPGSYSVQWDASNHSSGMYFARLSSGGKSQVKKLMLQK